MYLFGNNNVIKYKQKLFSFSNHVIHNLHTPGTSISDFFDHLVDLYVAYSRQGCSIGSVKTRKNDLKISRRFSSVGNTTPISGSDDITLFILLVSSIEVTIFRYRM